MITSLRRTDQASPRASIDRICRCEGDPSGVQTEPRQAPPGILLATTRPQRGRVAEPLPSLPDPGAGFPTGGSRLGKAAIRAGDGDG
jgi:hypothetical protein